MEEKVRPSVRVARRLLSVTKGGRKLRHIVRGMVGGNLSRKRGGVDVILRHGRRRTMLQVDGRIVRSRRVSVRRIFSEFCGTSITEDGASAKLKLSVTGRLVGHVGKRVDTGARGGRFVVRVEFPLSVWGVDGGYALLDCGTRL